MARRSMRGWVAFASATAAVVLAAAFAVWAHTGPAYNTGETTLEANPGLWFQVIVLVPLGFSLVTWLLLHLACRKGDPRLRTAGATLAGLLYAFALISGFSVGLLFMPAAAALIVAVALTPAGD